MPQNDSLINDPKFNIWCDNLDRYARKLGMGSGHTIGTGRECWIWHYEEGMTPEEALAEDFSNI